MKSFEFNVSDYFNLQGGFIALVGTMEPDDFPLITSHYYVKLRTKSGREHVFKNIGEEIFVRRNPSKNDKRAFKTRDDIEEYLQDLINDPVRIVGYKIEN